MQSIGKDQSSILGSPSMVVAVDGTSECDVGVVLCKPQPPGNALTMHPSRSSGRVILLTTGAPERTTGSGRHLDEFHRLQRVGSKGPPSEYKRRRCFKI
ncbi:hypothetical protein Tco_0540607 [Tanacetum coccineum]